MLEELILALVLMAIITALFKLAVAALVLAGLIFRTRETIGLLIGGAAIVGFQNHPKVALAISGVVGLLALIPSRKSWRRKKTATQLILAPV